MNELISVIVPIYNVEKYVSKCIDSIINQSYGNIEIILVDDGSTDNSSSIIEDYKKIDKRIKVYHKKNGGLSDARNFGIKKSKGNYFCFIDSDDWIDKDFIEFLYRNLIENDCEISICNKYIDYDDGTQWIPSSSNRITIMEKEKALIYLNSFKGFDMSACDKMFKRSSFENIEFPIGKKCEDFYTIFKTFDQCEKIVFIDTPKYHYFQRKGSITRNNNINTSYVDAAIYQINYFEKKHLNLVPYAKSMYVFCILSNYNDYIKNGIEIEQEKIQHYSEEIRTNLKFVIKNRYIRLYKKLQVFCFLINKKLYCSIIKRRG